MREVTRTSENIFEGREEDFISRLSSMTPYRREKWWTTVSEHGLPLWDEEAGCATFMWKETSNPHYRRGQRAQSVAVWISGIEEHSRAAQPLCRIPETDIWVTTLPLPADLRASYGFLVDQRAEFGTSWHKRCQILYQDPAAALPQLTQNGVHGFSVFAGPDAVRQHEWEVPLPQRILCRGNVHEETISDGKKKFHVWLYLSHPGRGGSWKAPLPLIALAGGFRWFRDLGCHVLLILRSVHAEFHRLPSSGSVRINVERIIQEFPICLAF